MTKPNPDDPKGHLHWIKSVVAAELKCREATNDRFCMQAVGAAMVELREVSEGAADRAGWILAEVLLAPGLANRPGSAARRAAVAWREAALALAKAHVALGEAREEERQLLAACQPKGSLEESTDG